MARRMNATCGRVVLCAASPRYDVISSRFEHCLSHPQLRNRDRTRARRAETKPGSRTSRFWPDDQSTFRLAVAKINEPFLSNHCEGGESRLSAAVRTVSLSQLRMAADVSRGLSIDIMWPAAGMTTSRALGMAAAIS